MARTKSTKKKPSLWKPIPPSGKNLTDKWLKCLLRRDSMKDLKSKFGKDLKKYGYKKISKMNKNGLVNNICKMHKENYQWKS